jgi:hypothetical protein
MNDRTRGEIMLDFIYDEVDQRLNPNGEECWNCGGEGATFDCIDGCCVDAESGCEDCERPCIECKINAGLRAKAIREEVIKSNDIETAIAWIKSVGRWRDDITHESVRAELELAADKLNQPKGENHGQPDNRAEGAAIARPEGDEAEQETGGG